jgi:cyclopropane fatty-acyl-phospholipid synthase-like methyltransferase
MTTGESSSTKHTEYSEDYFLTACDGHAEYSTGRGLVLSERLQAIWHYLQVQPGITVLDLGCGRGEITVQCGLTGADAVGIDYSIASIRLAGETIRHAENLNRDLWRRPLLAVGNAKLLPFEDRTFDRAVMSDLVEHLYPAELAIALEEVYRVLAPGGELLIHTMPNLWYYHFGYPIFRAVQRVQGKQLPADPRDRFRYSHVHVNEQTPLSLRRTLANSSFTSWSVWLHDYRTYPTYSWAMRRSMRLLTTLPLLKWVFCDDIFARARK